MFLSKQVKLLIDYILQDAVPFLERVRPAQDVGERVPSLLRGVVGHGVEERHVQRQDGYGRCARTPQGQLALKQLLVNEMRFRVYFPEISDKKSTHFFKHFGTLVMLTYYNFLTPVPSLFQ